MNLHEALVRAERYLSGLGIEDARTDAWLLFEHVTGLSRASFLANLREPLAQEHQRRYRELLEKRGQHIPLQHLTGEQEFMGLPFLVNEHVLVPRQDTEILVEEALARLSPGMRVLDLCTGSGCIAVSLARLGGSVGRTARRGAAPGDAGAPADDIRIDASDLSEEALAVARGNAQRLGAGVRFFESDLFAQIDGVYDMIVSNPPYIRTAQIEELAEEVRLHEPRRALDGGEDGLYFYRAIVGGSPAHLRDGGWLLFEIGCDQGREVSGLLEAAGYTQVKVIQDLAGLDRVVCGRRPEKETQEGIHV